MDANRSMSTLSDLASKNTFPIYEITDEKFKKYGKLLKAKNYQKIYKALLSTEIPKTGNTYVRDADFEVKEEKVSLEKSVFGYQNVEMGYCNGHSHQLNALEYHMCREVNLAGTDLVLLLGKKEDIQDTYPSKKVEAFFVPKGTLFYIEPTVLHFAPCATSDAGFQCLVVLTEGTNSPLDNPHEFDEDLLMKNKWIICHPENVKSIKNGVRSIIKGDNIILNY